MDLRDRFAAHFAAALVDAFTDADQIARRAYDLAEAMLGERARRVDAGEGSFHGALLDAPEPLIEPDPGYEGDLDPSWLEPPYDPSWDMDTRWSADPSPVEIAARPSGPGLARTVPEEVGDEPRKERSAG